MARSTDINQRITLTGGEEVRRHLEAIGKAGERSGNQTRQALLSAASGANTFTAGARAAGTSSGQMRFALQNLSFQVNDVATSLASGGDAMRVFAQQGGQIFQVFQQGGGARAVLGAAASAIRSMITPMTLAAGAAVALGAGFAAILSRAAGAQATAREFDIILKGMGKSSQATGKQLEEASRRLRDVGLSATEAQKVFQSAIRQGIKPAEVERIVRIGQNLNTVLGEGSLEEFVTAVAKGGEPLRQFAERLGIVSKGASDSTAQLRGAAGEISSTNKAINDALASRNRAIAAQQSQAASQIVELTRKRGTAEEEIEYGSKQRILAINQESILAINALISQRNEDNAKSLAAYNKQIEEAAQKALESGQGLIGQIEKQVAGANQSALGPLREAMRELGIVWDQTLTRLSNDENFQAIIRGFTRVLKVVTDLIRALGQIPGLTGGVAAGGSIDIPGGATGGLVRGPGSGTSDSIVARISNGEFIMNALATKMNLPILQAMNSLNRPLMPRTRMPKFAAGGMVVANAGRGAAATINLHIGDEVFRLDSDTATAQRITRYARRHSRLSLGRRPSTA